MISSEWIRPGLLLAQMAAAARTRFASDARWAAACGLPKETLSRLKKNPSCDLRTLGALAHAAGCTLVAVPSVRGGGVHMPASFDRAYEEALARLCASGNTEAERWLAHGPAYFMGGLAVLVAGARGFDRERYLRLAEALHPGICAPEVFGAWLDRSPVQPSRFLPMTRKNKAVA